MKSIATQPYHVSLWGVVVGVLILTLASASLVLGGLVHAQEDPIEYPEKGTRAVATYTAVDPDGSEIVLWSLDGTDKDAFKIEDGVLSFKKSPNFESATDVAGTSPSRAVAGDNIYEVTVQATDATKRIGMKDVTVEVTNMEEDGSMRLSAVQPQAGTSFYVIDEDGGTTGTQIKDEDGITSPIKWQWSKSRSKTTGFADIDKATNAAYTPKDTDDDYYLRVTASYTDREGPDKSEQATSDYPVQLAPSNNAAPKFADDQDPDMTGDQEAAARTIAENTPKGVDIGSPVEASDLNPGKLTYTLEGADADMFDIDRETGQLKTKDTLDADASGGGSHTVTVRATDPSGDPHDATATDRDTYSDTVVVVITVEDLTEDPQISDESIAGFAENGDIADALAAFQATTEDTATISRWSLAGPDGSKFTVTDGELKFEEQPDYEKPGDADGNNMYEVTVRATDSDSRTGTRDVTVEVTNDDEVGTVSLSPTQHRVGVPITAKLKDTDDGVYGEMWQWSIGSNAASTVAGDISGANSDTYTPKAGDIGGRLTATVTYRDAAGRDVDDTANAPGDDAVLRDTRNKAPVFKAKNEVITQAERSVAESVMGVADDDAADATDDAADNVGATIVAEDSNIATGAEGDSLAFSLSGPDESKFRFRAPPSTDTGATRSVQIEVKVGTKFDFETDDTYMVTLTVTDDYGETAELALTINITDVNDAPDVTGLSEVEYPEKGTRAVATYTAVDPDGSEIVLWSLDGTDKDAFKIEDGVLSFKKSPNFESATDVAGTSPSRAVAGDNIYEVMVQATDATKRIGTKGVTVEVTNVEEGGSMRLSAVQPQAGTSFYVIDEDETSATVTNIKDEDGITSSITWQWSKSRSKTRSFSAIDKATNPAYTPKDTDDDYYLRVTASYTDREGPNKSKSAQATSDYPVQLAPSNNAAPKFADDQDPDMTGDQEAAARTIAENTPKGVDIGSPVEASDLNPGKLTYTLEGADADMFDIDRETGQLKTKDTLDADASGGGSHTVTVRATDPSGDPHDATATDRDTYSDTVVVVITVEDLTEDPQISDESIAGFAENGDIADALAAFQATTEDTATISRWSLAGPDGSKFTVTDGELKFEEQPNYEKPGDADGDNMYEVTVRATDSDSRTGTRDVTVEVTNDDEDGTVTLSPTQHRVGVPITATLKDDDGGVYGKMWQWSIGSNAASTVAGDISGANSDTYTPKAGDIGGRLTATVTYRDAAGRDVDDTANAPGDDAVLRDTRNKAPVFKAKGAVITQAERSVAESVMGVADDDAADATDNAADNVGATIVAEDPNIATAEGDSLTFSLSGPDESKFRFRAPPSTDTGATRSVQIEVKVGTKFDFETDDPYMVTLTATDDYGESADLELTINITDANEAPVIMVGGLAISGDRSVEVKEGNTAVATYTAVGPDADMATWSRSGADARDFTFTGGVLAFSSEPDFENPADEDGDNVYMVTVEADDGTYMDTQDVTVTVTNVGELGTLSGPAGVDNYMENGTSTVATYSTDGPVEATLTLEGDDAGDLIISGGMLSFSSPPDYEAAADADMDNTYMVTVKADAGGEMATQSVTVTVINVDELGMLSGPAREDNYMENGTSTVATYSTDGPVEATWSLEGDDAGDFSISGGMLSFSSPPDYEAAADADMDNTYMVTVKADAGGEMARQPFTVTVTNVDEAPDVTGDATAEYAENATSTVATYTAVDPEGAEIVWSLGGDDAALFSIEGGMLTFVSAPDFESPADMGEDNVYQVTVEAGDGTNMDTQNVTVTVTNVDEAPDVTGDATAEYAENATSTVATYTAVDPEGAEIVWSLGGDDAALFSIDGGELAFMSPPDFESPADMGEDNVYQVTVEAGDGTNMDTQNVTVTVTNVDEAPDVTGDATAEYAENATSTVATYTAMDPEGAEIVWSLGGDDAALFSIDGGELAFMSPPDFESPADMGEDNVYQVTVEAGDGTNMDTQAVTVTVTNVEEDPLLAEFDPNGDDMIERADMRRAVADFFGPSPTLSRADMRRLVGIYFAQ